MTKVTQKATSMFDLKISQGITHIMTVICWMKKEMCPKNFDLRSQAREKVKMMSQKQIREARRKICAKVDMATITSS